MIIIGMGNPLTFSQIERCCIYKYYVTGVTGRDRKESICSSVSLRTVIAIHRVIRIISVQNKISTLSMSGEFSLKKKGTKKRHFK